MATSKKPPKKPAAKAAAKRPAAKKAAPKKKPARLTLENKPSEKPEVKREVGRPSVYKPEYADLAYKFCLLGAKNDKLAELFDVATSTIGKWISEIEEFSDAVKRGRELADANVANSLYHRAIGYEHPEDDIRTVSLGMNAGSEIVITPTIKRYAPDTGAATLWLKNRQPHLWRDKVEVEHGGHMGLDKAPISELTATLNELLAKLK